LWIQAVVQRELARLLGTAPEEIDTSRPVIDLGIDSLMAVELGVVLSKTIQMEVPTMTLLGGSSIAQFAATLCPVTDDVAADGAAALAPVAAGL
jgi:acyl carrier protein